MTVLQKRFKEIFVYEPANGWLTNRFSRSSRALAGERAGCADGKYRSVYVDGTKYREHQIVWIYVYGNWPDYIDHRDGDGTNNRLSNLRKVDKYESNQNVTHVVGLSGLRGALLDSERSKWRSYIHVRGRSIFLGRFDTPEEANQAYLAAVDKYHGEFAIHNRPLRRRL